MKSFPWFDHYAEGVPHEIDPDKLSSLVELFEEACQKYADKPACENMGVSITYRDLEELSRNFAVWLQHETDLEKGDRIAIQMPNLLQYPVALFGALRAGLVVVNTNPLYTPREMKHQYSDSGTSAIIILENFAHKLEEILPQTAIQTVIVTRIGDLLGGLKGTIVNAVVKYVKKMVPGYHLPGAIPFKQVLNKGSKHSYQRPDIDSNDTAFLQYTGGTTGVAKAAVLSHRNIVANVLQCEAWFVGLKNGEEVCITALPLYHVFALTVNGLLMLHIGAKSVLITNPRDMPAFIKELKKQPFSVFIGINTLFNGLLNQEEFRSIDFSAVKITVGGGMAVQKSVEERWRALTGASICEGYGLSETSPVLTANPIGNAEVRIGTIGLPLPGTEVAILDEEGHRLPPGEPGEIGAKGPQVMKGYWQQPEENEKAFVNGWFRTGDIGTMDEEGFFRIVDRKKDMINVSGFNVYPNEVEDVIASNPKVQEVGAIGVSDEKSGEVVKVFIVKKDSSLTEDEVKAWCREHLTGYKRPKHIEFKDELPKTPVGKILRKELRPENDA